MSHLLRPFKEERVRGRGQASSTTSVKRWVAAHHLIKMECP
jgi:hypothetical protein